EAIIKFGNENDFIIVELPWEIRFADLQRATMKKINNHLENYFQSVRDIQKQLIDLVIQGRTLVDILRYFEQKTASSVVYSDSKGRLVSPNNHPQQLKNQWKQLQENAEVTRPGTHHVQQIIHDSGVI